VKKRLVFLLRTPFFWWVTLWGNAWVGFGALAFHRTESGINPSVHSFLDSLSWAVGIVTTVGGGIYPVTQVGKVLAILMMMGGALFLWSYMALFVGAFVDPELQQIEREVSEIQRDLAGGGPLGIDPAKSGAEEKR
jgi:hypothetical protein